MKVGELQDILKDCSRDGEILIFAETEGDLYRPFHNIKCEVYNKGAYNESVHLDVSINKEYHNIHFPDNPTLEDIEDLREQKQMLLEELEEVNKKLEGFI